MSPLTSSLPCIRLVLLPVLLIPVAACQKAGPTPTAVTTAVQSSAPASPASAGATQSRPAPAAPAAAARASLKVAEITRAKSELSIRRFEVANEVVEREPSTRTPFKAGKDKIYAFIDVANVSSAPAELVVTFERPGVPSTGHVTLSVPARQARWRTWAFTRGVRTPGEWTVRVRTTDGQELASKRFTVESAGDVGQASVGAPGEA